MSRSASLVLILFVLCALLSVCGDKGADKEILALKETDDGKSFFQDHSITNMQHVILFLKDPTKYFVKVKDVQDIYGYIGLYEAFLSKNGRLTSSLFDQFRRSHFQTVDEQKASILTYLVMVPGGGVYKEMAADQWTLCFRSQYKIFIKVLESVPNWKVLFHEGLETGNWDAFKEGLKKLGDSGFEKEFKEYAFAWANKDRPKIIN